jgi:hypothetical protein
MLLTTFRCIARPISGGNASDCEKSSGSEKRNEQTTHVASVDDLALLSAQPVMRSHSIFALSGGS